MVMSIWIDYFSVSLLFPCYKICLLLCIFLGTSASAMHFQMYLLEGVSRWNADREVAICDLPQSSSLRCFDVWLKNSVNSLSTSVLGQKEIPEFEAPGRYTGRY